MLWKSFDCCVSSGNEYSLGVNLSISFIHLITKYVFDDKPGISQTDGDLEMDKKAVDMES